MPLCRECHIRETMIQGDNIFKGDPSKTDAELENKQFAEKRE